MKSGIKFTELIVSERAYKYIREIPIRSSEEALVELITNCIDAYNKTNKNPRDIFIEFQYPNSLKVRDHALGLTSAEMERYFLQVGNSPNGENSRGFFSRGAKDISAIGNIYFRSIKDNKFSVCILNSDMYGRVAIRDVEATNEIREELQIKDNLNGLEVEIKLSDDFIINNLSELSNPSGQAESLSNLVALRDIMQNPDNNIIYSHVDVDGTHLFDKKLNFHHPDGNLLLDLEYEVPSYPGINAKFVVYKSLHPVPRPKKENEIISGFLIKSNTTVYEVLGINDINDINDINYINIFEKDCGFFHLHGHIKCDYIDFLLREFDVYGQTDKNPFPIISVSRFINKEHPFIKMLLSVPKIRLVEIIGY